MTAVQVNILNCLTVILILLNELSTIGFVASEESKCDPFPFGTNILNVVVAAIIGSILPNFCPCSQPCTAQGVEEHIQFFYTKSGYDNYYRLDVNDRNDTNAIVQDDDIKFLIHGYTDRVQFNKTGWMEFVGFALANATNSTVILVDYKNISSCSYSRSVQEIAPSVGNYLAHAITKLDLDTEKIELIGHSLGAHIAGYAGTSLNGSISRITGLDPVGPGFDSFGTKSGLNKTCAQFVQVLHTNPGELGTTEQRGDLNFYANNKTNLQPGCPFKQCGHAKAIFYYFASLFPQHEFIGVNCEQQDSRQTDIIFSRFGFLNDGNEGIFCFNTTSCFPFTPVIQLTSTGISTAVTTRASEKSTIPSSTVSSSTVSSSTVSTDSSSTVSSSTVSSSTVSSSTVSSSTDSSSTDTSSTVSSSTNSSSTVSLSTNSSSTVSSSTVCSSTVSTDSSSTVSSSTDTSSTVSSSTNSSSTVSLSTDSSSTVSSSTVSSSTVSTDSSSTVSSSTVSTSTVSSTIEFSPTIEFSSTTNDISITASSSTVEVKTSTEIQKSWNHEWFSFSNKIWSHFF